MNSLSAKIEQEISNLDASVQKELEGLITLKHINKGDYLLEAGNTCKSCFILESGIARKFLMSDNKEVTTELYFGGDVAVSLSSFSQQVPSKEWIQVLTNASVHQIHFDDFRQLNKRYPELIRLDLTITEHYSIWMESKLIDFRTKTASDRYLELIENNPHYIQHIPLTIIASYLGIAIETLSRIRNKL